MSMDILFWAFLASYVIHIVDETTMNGGFIRWFQASFWPTYSARMNFWFNGGAVLHLYWTIRQMNLSPGLVTSVIYWIMGYFFVRYGLLGGQIASTDFWIGTLLGVLTVGAFLTFVPTVVIPKLIRSRMQRATP